MSLRAHPPLFAAALTAATLAVAGCGEDELAPTSSAPPDVETVEVGGSPVAVAAGEGGVWVADNIQRAVVRLDPASGEVSARARVGEGPLAVATGEGAVWAASGDGSISRIDPETGEASRLARVSDPRGIAGGPGAVWVTSGSGGSVTRLGAADGEPVGEPIAVGADPGDVAVSPEAVWVANGGDGTVTRIDPESGTPAETIDVGERVFALTYGEGAVWVAKSDDRLNRTVEVVRIDPESSEVDGDPVAIDAALPVRLAAGEGAVWATLAGGVRPPEAKVPPSVVRIDPSEVETVGDPVRVGESPAGIATGEGAVWVASSGDGTVTQLEPAP